MVLDASLLNSQQYKVQIKGKWSNPGNGAAPFGVVAIEKGTLGLRSTTVRQLIYEYINPFSSYGQIVRHPGLFNLFMPTALGKFCI